MINVASISSLSQLVHHMRAGWKEHDVHLYLFFISAVEFRCLEKLIIGGLLFREPRATGFSRPRHASFALASIGVLLFTALIGYSETGWDSAPASEVVGCFSCISF